MQALQLLYEMVDKLATVLGTEEAAGRLAQPLPKGGAVIVLTAADRRRLEAMLRNLRQKVIFVRNSLDTDHNVGRRLRNDLWALFEEAKSLDVFEALLRAVPERDERGPPRGR